MIRLNVPHQNNATTMPALATVRFVWHRAGVVPVISVWQNVPCHIQWVCVVHYLHHLFSTAGVSAGSAVDHCVHSVPSSSRHSGEARCISTHVCRQHTCVSSHMTSSAAQLKRRIADVGHWMSANRLKLNKDKTELLWVGSRHSLS